MCLNVRAAKWVPTIPTADRQKVDSVAGGTLLTDVEEGAHARKSAFHVHVRAGHVQRKQVT